MDSRLRTPEQVYEWYVEVSRPKDGEDGQITYVYPKDHEIEDDTRKQLPKFTFPTTVVNENEEHFTFVLTDLDSKYRFGFCLYRPKGDICMCIISDLPWYKVFYRALDKISEFKLAMQNELVEPLLSGLYSQPIPSPDDESLSVQPSGAPDAPFYSFPLPASPSKRLPEIPTDHNLTFFYTNIHYNVLLHLFANMIFERRIIITSSSLSLLSASVHGAVMLLYPLFWQHIFIPIMPQHLKDYCAAPMPFLMGVHSSLMEDVRRMPLDDVVILDMDDNVIESPNVDDLGNMPVDVIAELKHVLKKESSGYGDNACKAFMLAMVSMIGGYRKALKFREGEAEVVFDEEAFYTSRPQMEEFLSTLLHFQHFRQFINNKIEQLKHRTTVRDLFDMEAMFYDDEMNGSTQEKIRTAFNKFVVSTRGGGKKLWEKSEKLSTQLQKRVTKGYGRIVDKKTFQKFVKDTKRTFQERGRDRIEDSGGENGPLEKSNIFPSSSSTSLSRSSSGLSTSSPQGVRKQPPRVIPYHKHQEGKKRLAEVLKQQGQRGSGTFDQMAVLKYLNSPESAVPDDVAEKASLDSRGSTEASISISSGEVATGTLIELADPAVTERDQMATKEEASVSEQQPRERSSTGSDSMVSTASSSSVEITMTTPSGAPSGAALPSGQRRGWVNFEEDDSHKPPLPPPRSELEDFTSGSVLANPLVQEETPDYSPFNSLDPQNNDPSGRLSPFDDFSAQVAKSLFAQSRNRSSLDSYTADLMVHASRDIMAVGALSVPSSIQERRESEVSLPEPLIPTSSSSSLSSLDHGSCTAGSRLASGVATNPFSSLPLSTASNGFPAHPLVQRECVRPRGPPPPKPQPYSGKPVSALAKGTLSPDDPFGNLLEGMTMQAYAKSTSPSPSNNMMGSSPTQQLSSSSSTQHTSVESPIV